MAAPAVGIDLGTTNSVVAVSVGGRPQVLTDASGGTLIPSVVSFAESGERIVGRAARMRRAIDPRNTVYSVKRLLGRPFKSEEVRRARSRMPFDLKEGADSSVIVSTRGGDHALPELSAMVLRECKRIAEMGLQDKVERCVITVPANFNELQRSSTKVAGRIAELEVVRILNEPTAAALAYGYGRGTREKICIYDFGGGTFDVTLLELSGNVFEVLATAGDTFLGGDDIDVAITDSLLQNFQRTTSLDPLQDRVLYDILRDAAETAKCDLSTREQSRLNVDITLPNGQPVKFAQGLSRAELERLSAPFVSRTFDVCAEALKLAGLRPTDLTAVILVGGSTRIPTVRQRVSAFFSREPLTNLPPEEVVALGASILAEALTGGARKSPNTRPVTGSGVGARSSPSTRPGAVAAGVPGAPVSEHSGATNRTTLTGVGDDSGANTLPRPPAGAVIPPPVPNSALRGSTRPPPLPGKPQGPVIPKPPARSLELDDPFTDMSNATVMQPSPMERTVAQEAPSGLDQLDEPSFMGRLKNVDPTVSVQVPAFNLDDPSMVGPLPTSNPQLPAVANRPALPSPASGPELITPPPLNRTNLPAPKPVAPPPPRQPMTAPAPPAPPPPVVPPPMRHEASQPGLRPEIASVLPPAIAAAISAPRSLAEHAAPPRTHEHSVPSFHLDDAMLGGGDRSNPGVRLGGDASSPGARIEGGKDDVSIPSFRIDTEEIFGHSVGNAATMIAKSPLQAPVDENTRAMPVAGNVTQKVAAVAPPVTGPATSTPRTQPPPAAYPSQAPHAPERPSSVAPPQASQMGGGSMRPMSAPLLLDVTPFSLGVETAGGLCEAVIRRNATIPVEQTRNFATTNDQQDSVIIRIAQGESRKFPDNQALGELELTNLRPAPRGEVVVAVTFELEADGTLRVRAKDVETGREQAVRVNLLTIPSEGEQADMAARSRSAVVAVP
jgi:molecular chaperone DnaK